MRKRFFLKHFALFVIPFIVPMVLLGGFSIYTAADVVQQELYRNNLNMLTQCRTNVEMVFSELDSIRSSFDSNYAIINNLKGILESSSLALEQYRNLDIIKNFINAPANTKPYIHSMYVYFPNERNLFLATHDGLVNVDTFYDHGWYESFLRAPNQLQYWTEERLLQRYDFRKTPDMVFTSYKRTYPAGALASNGVIVINIYFDQLNRLLTELITLPDQVILVVDADNKVLLQSSTPSYLAGIDIGSIIADSADNYEYTSGLTAYNISLLPSLRNDNWTYVSIVPRTVLLSATGRMTQATIFFLTASLVLGVLMARRSAKNSYRQLESTIDIIHQAQNGMPLPNPPSRIRDEYAYIQYNILKTFLEQSYLKVQLSEKHYRLQTAELLALQSQLNPHFLYNTLETVNWIAIRQVGHPNQISAILEDLSSILRYSLDDPDKPATVETEITNTKCYIAIQKVRYANKFDVLWQYPEGIETLSILRLLLQPLVENSLYHGIKVKEGKGTIKIRIRPREETLRITVTDNGAGMSCEKLAELTRSLHEEQDSHIGLHNTVRRLSVFYDNRATLRVRSKLGVGTSIVIDLPY